MTRIKLDRRTMLRGMLGGTLVNIGLPMLDIFVNNNGTAMAGGRPFPKRFGIYFWGNGNRPEAWTPLSEGYDWEASYLLEPLAEMKHKISVVTGTRVYVENNAPHWAGAAGILTASPAPFDVETREARFLAPTIDQVIANKLLENPLNTTRFKSIEYGVKAQGGQSYNGPNSLNPAEENPRTLFNRIFTNGFREPGDDSEADPSLGLRKSVLDAVMGQSKKLESVLGARDRERLEQHLTGVRELEERITFLIENPITFEACAIPDAPAPEYPDVDGRPQITEAAKAMNDVMTMALACGQTNVFSNWMTAPVNNLLFEGASAGHHQLTHDEPGDQPQVRKIIRDLMTEFNRMCASLDAVPEGDGTLLDNCCIFGTSDVSEGRTHSLEDFPILIAGSAGGALKTGYHYHSATGENSTKALISMMNAMDISVNEYGQQDARATTNLAGIMNDA